MAIWLKFMLFGAILGIAAGVECLNCYINAPPVPGYHSMSKPEIRFLFKRAPMWINLPNCTDSYYRYSECNGVCLSTTVMRPMDNVIATVHSCSKQYEPRDFKDMSVGKCYAGTTFGIQKNMDFRHCLCNTNRCNEPANPVDPEMKIGNNEPGNNSTSMPSSSTSPSSSSGPSPSTNHNRMTSTSLSSSTSPQPVVPSGPSGPSHSSGPSRRQEPPRGAGPSRDSTEDQYKEPQPYGADSFFGGISKSASTTGCGVFKVMAMVCAAILAIKMF